MRVQMVSFMSARCSYDATLASSTNIKSAIFFSVTQEKGDIYLLRISPLIALIASVATKIKGRIPHQSFSTYVLRKRTADVQTMQMFQIVSETHFSLKPSEVQPNLKVNPF